MRKLLLTTAIVSAFSVMAEPPQTSFYLSGFNGVSTSTEANTLAYSPGNEDDEEEGLYRFICNDFVVENCPEGFYAVGADGLKLGFDEGNEFFTTNMVNDVSTMIGMADGGPAVNCELTPGHYKVILASMFAEDGVSYTWNIMFQSLGGEEDVNYYLLGFNGDMEPSQSNMLIKEEVEEDGETTVMYKYPKFYVESCSDGFYVGDSKSAFLGLDANFESFAPAVSDESPMAFLAAGGKAVPCSLAPGYYTVKFVPTGTSYMISFLRCDDQTSVNESEYYMLGFDGITSPSDAVKFKRVESSYEEDGETYFSYSYVIEKIHLKSCPDGFTIATADGGFSFGLNIELAAMLGGTVTEAMPMGFLSLYGEPMKWELPENDYTVTFSCDGTVGSVSFEVYDSASVDGIEIDENESPVYYNLQGVRVDNPGKGVYIRKMGNKTEKIMR